MCEGSTHLGIYWYFCLQNFFFKLYLELILTYCVCKKAIFVYVQVCVYKCLIEAELSSNMKASSRSPSHFLNSRRAHILILTVTALLLWSVVALVGSMLNQKYPLNSLRTQQSTTCFVRRHTVEKLGNKRQNHVKEGGNTTQKIMQKKQDCEKGNDWENSRVNSFNYKPPSTCHKDFCYVIWPHKQW